MNVILIIPVLLLGFNISCYGQLSGKLTYKVILESNDYEVMESTLLFNKDSSLFFINNKEYQESIGKNNDKLSTVDSDENDIGFKIKPPVQKLTHEVYINRKDNQIKARKFVYKNGEYLPSVVVEPSGTIEWELKNEHKTIGSYNALKATSSFRGRNYTAWYTEDVKVDIGPWKFQGLPGLILEVTDEEKSVMFNFSSATIPYRHTSDDFTIIEDLKLSIDEYAELNRPEAVTNEFIKWLNSSLPENGMLIDTSNISINYTRNGIEKEFN
jgi:GLPGLI family protein